MLRGKTVLNLSLGAMLTLAAGAIPAAAQTTANGPYYATPAWDQSLPASTRFIVLTNLASNAVLDRETGLVWERTPSTAFIPALLPPNEVSLNFAAAHCITLNIGGRYGWRLPTIQELETLFDDTQNPALPAGNPFTGIGGRYWTSTQTSAGLGSGELYSFGFTGPFELGLTFTAPDFGAIKAWCVRGGSGADIQ